MTATSYSTEELIDYLRDADRAVDGSITFHEFDKMDGPATSTIIDYFGSWNDGKRAAGLLAVPEHGDTSLTKEVYYDIKESVRCQICGEGRRPALQFHHLPNTEKEAAVGEMVRDGYALPTILNEMKKCAVLCSNCHSCIHSDEEAPGEDNLSSLEPTEHTKQIL